jgi:dTDP-4-amino-4,6-dideoxygalactose transaminase
VKLILDAAHGLFAKYDNKDVHAFADMTCYSLQAIKHITTGDGGVLICSSDEDHARAKRLKWFGLDRDRAKDERGNWKGQQWDVDIEEVGYKFNMNNISAAIGLSQLSHMTNVMARHRLHAKYYDELLTNNLIIPIKKDEKANGSSWVYTVLLRRELSHRRNYILQKLNEDGIHAGVVHVPNHSYTVFKDELRELPNTDEFFSRQFSLPCGWWMTKSDVGHIVDRLLIHVENAAEGRE